MPPEMGRRRWELYSSIPLSRYKSNRVSPHTPGVPTVSRKYASQYRCHSNIPCELYNQHRTAEFPTVKDGFAKEGGTTGGTNNAVILLQDRSATEFHSVLMDVKVGLAHEVLDLVQPRFQLSILKDCGSGRGAEHVQQGSVRVKRKSNLLHLPIGQPSDQGVTVCSGQPESQIGPTRSTLNSDESSGEGKKKG